MPLPNLVVPDRYRPGIIRVAQLEQKTFDELLAALRRAPSCQDTRELVNWLTGDIPSLSAKEQKEIVTSLVPMFRVQQNSNVNVSDFVSDVWSSVADDAEGVDEGVFKQRLEQLLNESALDLATSRISDVRLEVERSFCKVRVLTDLRPAFRKNADEAPTEMAIIHNFQLGYHDGTGQHQEFFVSLDGEDLEKLKKAITQAQKRAQSLETLLGKSGVRLHK